MTNRFATPMCAVTLAAALAVGFGCAKKKSDEPAQSSGTDASPATEVVITSPVGFVWKWEGTQTPVERIAPDDPAKYTLEFLPDTSVVAQIDCNRGTGKYKTDGKSIFIGPLAVTRMACPTGSLDAKFAQQIDAARTIFFRGDTLFMDLFADSGTMKFSQMPEPQSK
jgi:heat shock protein HslJ